MVTNGSKDGGSPPPPYGQWLEDDTNVSSEFHNVVCPSITLKVPNIIIYSCFQQNRIACFPHFNHRQSLKVQYQRAHRQYDVQDQS